MTTAHIIYAALFRLAVIAAGFGCVVIGYRLFVLGVMPQNGSELDAKAGEIRLSLRNAAPGTCFATLGAFMIIAMLVQGNPEKRELQVPTKEGTRREVTWRSGNEDIFVAIARGRKLEQDGLLAEAIKAYADPLKNGNLSLKEATGPLRAISAVYLKQDRHDEAIAYASLAYQIDPDNAEGSALIARIQLRRGQHEEAINAISHAARIDPAFIAERDRMKEQKP
jgi:tetratricopeptide (TPR) repeat protein